MELATLVTLFLSGLLMSFTGYALYTAFGQPSQQLRDPFEEHGDELK
nr:photosystem II protein N [Cuscuta vandevenderi]WEY30098.1 photosystem II protein N [Cuscuta vandevenderi]